MVRRPVNSAENRKQQPSEQESLPQKIHGIPCCQLLPIVKNQGQHECQHGDGKGRIAARQAVQKHIPDTEKHIQVQLHPLLKQVQSEDQKHGCHAVQRIRMSESKIPSGFHPMSVIIGLIQMSLDACKSKSHKSKAAQHTGNKGHLHCSRNRNRPCRTQEYHDPKQIISSAEAPGQGSDQNTDCKHNVFRHCALPYTAGTADRKEQKGHSADQPHIRVCPAALIPDYKQNLSGKAKVKQACTDVIQPFVHVFSFS